MTPSPSLGYFMKFYFHEILKYFTIFSVSVMYIRTLVLCNARRGQKKVLDPLKLELGMIINRCVDAGN